MSYLPSFPSHHSVLVKLLLLLGVTLFNSLIWGEFLNFGLQNLASKTRNITLSHNA